jgi:hypothetical protein
LNYARAFGNLTESRRRRAARALFLSSSMVEHPAVNRRVAGSSPASGAFYLLKLVPT